MKTLYMQFYADSAYYYNKFFSFVIESEEKGTSLLKYFIRKGNRIRSAFIVIKDRLTERVENYQLDPVELKKFHDEVYQSKF